MPAGNLYGAHLDSADLIADFYPRLEAAMETLWAPRVAVEIPSDREVESINWLGQVPAMREWLGNRVEEPMNKYSVTVRNAKYEATLRISLDDLRRDKTGQLRQRVADLAARTATHWNELVGTWITNGEAGTSGLAYDGQFFFDTDHNESGANQTNDLTASDVPAANVSTTTTLTTTEAADIITQTIAYMKALTDDKGEPINAGASEVVILCTKVGHYNGIRTAIGLNNLGTGSGNNNPLLAWTDHPVSVYYVPQRVTAADKLYFFFGSPGMGSSPLIRTNELDVQAQLDTSQEFITDSHLFGVKAVRGVGYGMWQKAALVTLS
jgi:phage major head subunit gpT-like protein